MVLRAREELATPVHIKFFSTIAWHAKLMGKWYFRGAHSVHDLTVHLIFMPFGRMEIFKPKAGGWTHEQIVAQLHDLFSQICAHHDLRAHLISVGVDKNKPDHIHLVVRYPPTLSVSRLVQFLKGVSSRYWPEEIGGKHNGRLWSPAYFASSNGRSAADYAKQDKSAAAGGKR